MRQDWFIAATLSVSMLAMAQQQPKVINSQFHTESAGAGLSAAVNALQHSNGPLWLGYEVAAVPGSHFSMCSGDNDSSTDNGCCGVYRLEDSNNNFQSFHGFTITGGFVAGVNTLDFVVTDAGSLGRVMKMPVMGGAEVTLASEPGKFPAGLAVDKASAYVTEVVSKPVRQLNGILASIKAIIESLTVPNHGYRERYREPVIPDDKDMFV